MARTKQTARKSTGGKAPRKQLALFSAGLNMTSDQLEKLEEQERLEVEEAKELARRQAELQRDKAEAAKKRESDRIDSVFTLLDEVSLPEPMAENIRARVREDFTFGGMATSFLNVALGRDERLHCVRCHANYRESTNIYDSCRINHDGDTAEFEDGISNTYACCGRTADLTAENWWDEEAELEDSCFEGFHTTDYDDVEYTLRDREEERDEYRSNGNVKLCSENGCKPEHIARQKSTFPTLRGDNEVASDPKPSSGKSSDQDGGNDSEEPANKRRKLD